MEEERLLSFLTSAIFLLAAVNIASLSFISAPYGKHTRPGWGPRLPAALAWFLMESPTLVVPAVFLLRQNHILPLPLPLPSILPISLFLLHYLHRTLVYPLRLLLLPRASPVPASIAFLAFSFNVLNGYLQTLSLSLHPPPSGLARSALGVAVFLWGMYVNIRSDSALLKLRKEVVGYRIPSGWWFDAICCPNYMGEVVEWLGWAVVAWTPAALGFFVYTCSNLVPRARESRRWYMKKFGEEYPESRKAIVPFLY